MRKGCLKIYNKNWRIDVLTLPAPRTSSTRGRRVARCLSSARKQSYPCPVISRISVDFARDGMLGNTVALRGPDCVGRGIRSIHVCMYVHFSFARSFLPERRRCQNFYPRSTGVTGEFMLCVVLVVLMSHSRRLGIVRLGLRARTWRSLPRALSDVAMVECCRDIIKII